MKHKKRESTDEHRKGGAIVKPSLTNMKRAEEKELLELVENMFHQKVDKSRIRRNVRLSARLRKVLSAASPDSTTNLVSGIAVDLADFWEIGEEHRQRVKELLKMRFPKDRKRLFDMLYDLEIGLVVHAEWHARHLKKFLIRFRKDFGR